MRDSHTPVTTRWTPRTQARKTAIQGLLVLLGWDRNPSYQEAPPNLLSDRLKLLVEAGVLRTRTYQEPGSRHRQSYHLTPAGQELRLVLAALQQWGDCHRPRPSGPSALRRSRSTGQAMRVGFLDDDGRELPAEDLTFVMNAGPEA
ncbi:winged helix-turn-helix transcriptional regulator [Streptomyces sp. NPDC059866]|uniref:winged helix-turn-helix transcriptional regulator n=1 Tax=Streptomyces sp. NPDC059866 TaxID=3346978 RepID=UPI00365ED29F